MKFQKRFVLVLLVLVLALGGCVAQQAATPTPVPGSRALTNLDSLAVSGTLATTGATTVGGGFGSTGCTFGAAGTLQCDGAATLGSTLSVTGTSTLTGATAADGGLTVGGGFGSTGCTVSTAGAVSCNGAATFASTMALTGNATLAGQVVFTAPTQITVTADSTIATANYTVVPLYAAGTVGTSAVTGCQTAGKLTILRNISNQTITITDTSTIMLGGNAALGQYDTLTLLGDGTNCLQISKADN